jgi:hypothetical protein
MLIMGTYSSAVLTFYGGDSTRYLRLPETGFVGLFDDPYIPAGYPAFLRSLRAVWAALPFTIGVQHLLGIAAALLLYLAARRAGAGRGPSLLPAVVVLYSGDQLFLEHAILTEALWTPLLAAGLYAAMRAVGDPPARRRALVATGSLLALAAIVRNVAVALPVIAAVWAALAFGGSWRERLSSAALVVVPAFLLIAGYAALARAEHGYAGFTDMSGFILYGRVGQFADCRKFAPPPGTEVLCERTPVGQREGPLHYTFDPAAPLYRRFGATPRDAAILGRFARQAILHQPVDYLRTVVKDGARNFVPDIGFDRPRSGAEPPSMSFARTVGAVQAQTPSQLAHQYRQVYSLVRAEPVDRGVGTVLGAYQSVFRIGGLELALFWILAIAAIVRGSAPIRAGAALTGLVSGYLFLAPAVAVTYDVRYSVPPATLLALAAALGIESLRRARPRSQIDG